MGKFYVVFDGPPSHESGRFVEVETEDGRGVGPEESGAKWAEYPRDRGLWRLGPFYSSPGSTAVDKVQHCDACKCVRGFLPDGSPCPGLPGVDVERVRLAGDCLAPLESENAKLRELLAQLEAALEGLKWNDVPNYGPCFCLAGTIENDDMHTDACVDANAAFPQGLQEVLKKTRKPKK